MNCRNCQYPLWRIKARQCPECGEPFSPADFDFVPYGVRFRCPHCEQEYYGDGERGRLVPAEFDCIGCGRHVTMAEMVVEPAAGVAEKQTQTRKVPWLERKSIGGWRAWVRTVGLAMVAPGELVSRLPSDGRTPTLGPALGFMLVSQVVIWLVAAIPLWGIMGVRLASRATGRSGGPIGADVWMLLVLFAVGLLATCIAGFVFALIAHLLLVLTGPREGGPRKTLMAMAYSSGANVLSAIPCVGVYLGWVWWVGSATVMLGRIQRVRAWRSVVAVIGPVAVAVALAVGGYAWFMYWALTKASATSATATAVTSSLARTTPSAAVSAALVSEAHRTGAWPTHIGGLLADGALNASQVIVPPDSWSHTTSDDVLIGDLTLAEFENATPGRRAKAADVAAALVSPQAAAYRVGDLVVCVRAGQPTSSVSGLWLLIAWPDPDTPWNAPPTFCLVTTADGVPRPVSAQEFDARLVSQNALRAGLGLPPLPHPRDVHQPRPRSVEDAPDGG